MNLKTYLDNTREENFRKREEARKIEAASTDKLCDQVREDTELTSRNMLDLFGDEIRSDEVADHVRDEIRTLSANAVEFEGDDAEQLTSSLTFANTLVTLVRSYQTNDGFDAEFYLSLAIQDAVEFRKLISYLNDSDGDGDLTIEKAEERQKTYYQYSERIDNLYQDMIDLKEYLESEGIF